MCCSAHLHEPSSFTNVISRSSNRRHAEPVGSVDRSVHTEPLMRGWSQFRREKGFPVRVKLTTRWSSFKLWRNEFFCSLSESHEGSTPDLRAEDCDLKIKGSPLFQEIFSWSSFCEDFCGLRRSSNLRCSCQTFWQLETETSSLISSLVPLAIFPPVDSFVVYKQYISRAGNIQERTGWNF